MNLDIVDGLNIAEVNNHWGWAMTSAEPLILTIAADEETGGDASELLPRYSGRVRPMLPRSKTTLKKSQR